MLRIMKAMTDGKETSFMEDYTFHLENGNEMVLGAVHHKMELSQMDYIQHLRRLFLYVCGSIEGQK